ncbi:hypothetical protein IE982_20810 [Enterobacter hormaechei]|nr:hypothetical protein [Enterobacter hormaechei]
MSTTDDSFSVTHDPIDIQRPSLKERWWHIMDTSENRHYTSAAVRSGGRADCD